VQKCTKLCKDIIPEGKVPVNELMEILFNITYLVVIYILVIIMAVRLVRGYASNRKAAMLFTAAFLLLGIGDTGHVGFRVIAYLSGGLEDNQMLVGMGSFATAVTVTVFYMLMFVLLRAYTQKKFTILFRIVMILGILRIAFMVLPGNTWGGATPLAYSWTRNGFLTIMGIITAVLYLKEGIKVSDRTLKMFAVCIFISYGFYLPVILFVHIVPAIGMLMIPKTCAYVAIAVIGAGRLFSKADSGSVEAE